MSIIQQTLKLYTQIAKAQNRMDYSESDREYLQKLVSDHDYWDKTKNESFFGHHDPMVGFIPTQYAPLNHIVENYKPLVLKYDVTDDPKTRVNFKHPEDTLIIMPHPSAFKTQAYYASTLMHELGHATQAPLQRLLVEPDSAILLKAGRDNPRRTEELVAQLTSYKLMNMVGVDTAEWSAIYMAGVLTTLPVFMHEVLLMEANVYSDAAFNYLTHLG